MRGRATRGFAECKAMADATLAAMPDRARAKTIDIFAELLCGGDDEARALTPHEAARQLGKSDDYGRALLRRLIDRDPRDPSPGPGLDRGVRPIRAKSILRRR